ncbi:MAG: hypothetical protein NVS3B1_01690 [Marmoricola sp.]
MTSRALATAATAVGPRSGIGWDNLNPFHDIGVLVHQGLSAATGVAADAFTAACLAVWDAGLFFFQLLLELMAYFLTPDLSENGPERQVYAYAFWMAGALLSILVMVQLALAAAQGSGKAVGRVLIGLGQFAMVCAAWIFYAVMIVAAAGGLTTSLTHAFFGGASLTGLSLWQPFDPKTITSAGAAFVLAVLGVFLIMSSAVHVFVYIGRAAALLVMVPTAPIAAAGTVSDFGRPWFWKTFRWFHAAAFTPVLMVLVLGIGSLVTQSVGQNLASSMHAAFADAVPGVFLICMSCVSPLALFKLLAFVEPGTPSGGAMRAGLAQSGGVKGLLGLGSASQSGGGGQASAMSAEGTASQGEAQGQEATAGRFQKALGSIHPMFGQAMGMAQSVGVRGIAIQSDLDNQAGVGHQASYPDFSDLSTKRPNNTPGTEGGSNPDASSSGPSDSTPLSQAPVHAAPTTNGGPPILGAPGTPGASGGATGTGAADGEAVGGAEAAALIV